MYSQGLGYQFTLCDQGVGVYILDDRKGDEKDLQYLNMSFESTGFNDILWSELYQAVDDFCVSQSLGGHLISAANLTVDEVSAIPVDWAAWY